MNTPKREKFSKYSFARGKQMNKRGFLRLVEAGLAILIILGAIFVNYQKLTVLKDPDLSENVRDILEEIAKNPGLRSDVLNNQNVTQKTIDFINESVPKYLSFEVRACEISNACGQSTYQGSVFSGERIISSDLNTFDPVKLRLFIWQEGF